MAEPWIKLWWDWYASRSHVLLSFDALHVGPFLLSLAKSSAGRLVKPDGSPYDPHTLGVLARMTGTRPEIEARMGIALLELVDAGTLTRDGQIFAFHASSWERFQSNHFGDPASAGAERQRRYRERKRDNSVTVTRDSDVLVTRNGSSLSRSTSHIIEEYELRDHDHDHDHKSNDHANFSETRANFFAQICNQNRSDRQRSSHVTMQLREGFPRFVRVLEFVARQRGDASDVPALLDALLDAARSSPWLREQPWCDASWIAGVKLQSDSAVEDRILKILDGHFDAVVRAKQRERAERSRKPQTQAQRIAEIAREERAKERARGEGPQELAESTIALMRIVGDGSG